MQGFDDKAIETREVEGMRVFVVGRGKKRGEKKGGWEVYGEATRGMVGGLGDGEEGV